MDEVFATALELAKAGYALTPVRITVGPNGKKEPRPCLKGWQSSADVEVLRDWFVQHRPNVWAQVCRDNGVDVVDLDPGASAGDGTLTWLASGLPESAMVVDTPSGGVHHLWREDAGRPLGVSAGRMPGVDTRSSSTGTQGGISFIVGVLPDGRMWKPRSVVPVAGLAVTPASVVDRLGGPKAVPPARDGGGTPDPFATPGRMFTRSQALKYWGDQLAELEAIAHIQGARHQTLVKVSRALGVFEGAVPGIREATWGRLRKALDGQPGVDIGAAERTFGDLWRAATDRASVIDDPPEDPFSPPGPTDGPVVGPGGPVPDDLDVDLEIYLSDDYEPERPDVGMERDDGARLLYAGKWSTLMGETGLGKSWIALWHCVEEIRRGAHVRYAHFEEANPRATVLRLRALGLKPEEIRERFHWLDLDKLSVSALRSPAAWGVPSLVVLDGIAAACGRYGWNINDAEAVTKYLKALVWPFTEQGAAVLSLGHPVKARDRQSERHGYGASAWLDLVDGSAFRVTASAHPIQRGKEGWVGLHVVKDRPGGVEERGVAAAVSEGMWTYLGSFHVIPPQAENGNAWCRLSTPGDVAKAAGDVDEVEPTEAAYRHLALMEVKTTANVKTIIAAVKEGKASGAVPETVRTGKAKGSEINLLWRDGYAAWLDGPGGVWLDELRAQSLTVDDPSLIVHDQEAHTGGPTRSSGPPSGPVGRGGPDDLGWDPFGSSG